MNKEEILGMEAGEELDKLVAVEVMEELMPEFTPENALDFQQVSSPVKSPKGNWLCLCRYDEGDIPTWRSVPFSTDISAAWPIADKMGLAVIPLNNGDWVCCKANYIYHLAITQNHYADPNVVICKAAPEAICKAALLTKLEEVIR